MARINFDDDIESKEEFWKLLSLLNGSRDLALGKLVRFFRLAQRKYGCGQVITPEEFEQHELIEMMKSGWAVPCGDGYQVIGAEKYFSWYVQRREAGKKGGRPKETGRLSEKTETEPESTPENPLAPALSPSPALVQKQEYIYSRARGAEEPPEAQDPEKAWSQERQEECEKQWLGTLEHFDVGRQLVLPHEKMAIREAIQRLGFKTTAYALAGIRFEAKTESYDPAKHLQIRRAFDPSLFEKWVNLACREVEKERRRNETRVLIPASGVVAC